jgi:hypothetical protein
LFRSRCLSSRREPFWSCSGRAPLELWWEGQRGGSLAPNESYRSVSVQSPLPSTASTSPASHIFRAAAQGWDSSEREILHTSAHHLAPSYTTITYRSRVVTLMRPQLLQSPRLLDTLAVHRTKSTFTTSGILAAYYPPTCLSYWRASVGDFEEREWPTFTTKDRSQIKRAINTSMEMHICQCI